MPVYEYRCKKCAHVFEEIVVRKEAGGEVRCPKCGGQAEKIMSVPQEPILV